ncbi:DUF4340 domain-containing protein [Neobacillus mesonae]|nr:DUF4340 domain-containing protein [Neobacillus mesonae]
MKKLLPTLILLLVLAGGWIYAHSQNYFQEEPEAAEMLMDTNVFDPSTITKFSVISGGEEVQLTKEQNEWVMTEPESYPVNSYAVDNWLSALSTAEISNVVEENPSDVEKYGLDPKGDGIVMTTQNGTEVTMAVGNMLPTGDNNYVQINEGQVVGVAATQISSLMLTPLQFMDTTPFEWDNDQLASLEWESEDISWVLKHKGDGENAWTLNGNDIELTDADSLMNQLKNIATGQVLQKLDQDAAKINFTLTAELQDGSSKVYQGWTDSSEEGEILVKKAEDSLSYVLSTENLQQVSDTAKELLDADANNDAAKTEE